MGRRALGKIDPSLDLSNHFYELEELTPPLTSTPLFRQGSPSRGERHPLEIEVGSGKGLFLESATAEHPGRLFLGIEIARKYARYSAARLAKRGRSNGAVICGDALPLFERFLPDASVSAIHVYFPDPWWKKRHRKRRIMNRRFLQQVQRTLHIGGWLHFWTDVQQYFRSSVELIREIPQLEGPFPVEEQPAEAAMDYRTHFERRMRIHHVPVYRARFRRGGEQVAVHSSAAAACSSSSASSSSRVASSEPEGCAAERR